MANAQLTGALRHLRETHALAQASDAHLLERFTAGREEAAFAALVRRHGPMVLGVARRVLPTAQDAEDVFQASFLLLASKAASIRKRDAVGCWLHGVAHRLAVRTKAQGARRRAREREAADMRDTRSDSGAARRDLQAALDAALGELPEKYRAALVLCHLEGKTLREAALVLDCPAATVGTRVARGRKLLRERLTSHGLTLSSAGLAALLMTSAASAAAPAALVRSAVRAALAFAAGQPAAALCSARVAGLVEGGLRAMTPSKLKLATALLLMAGALTGAAAWARGGGAAGEGARPRAGAEEKKKVAAPAGAKAEAGDAVEVSGQVVGDDGKPFAGAKLFLLTSAVKNKGDRTEKATTGADGRFRFAVSAADRSRGARVVASAPGHGPDWGYLRNDDRIGEFTLKLVKDDVPITGLLLDLEGRPAAGATVAVAWFDQVDLAPWLADRTKNHLTTTRGASPLTLDGPASVTADKDGRFRLTGFGRDRIAHLFVRGAGLADTDIEVLTRAGLPGGLRVQSRAVYPPDLVLTVNPSKPIVGTVRDKKTGKPVAGIKVVCPGGTWGWPSATTDAAGRYRIEGAGKRKDYTLAAGGLPYFNSTKMDIADTAGLDPLAVDFDLERGVAVKGKVTDKATGRPVSGNVGYVALSDNPHLKDFTDLGKGQIFAVALGTIAADGSFVVVCPPGPGLLAVRADAADRYAVADLAGTKNASGRILHDSNAVVRIDPSEDDEKSRTRDVVLESASGVSGSVVGPDGKPVAGAYAAGLHAVWSFGRGAEKLETASFTAHAVGAKPRAVVFVHSEKKLAKVVKAGSGTPLDVRLEATGSLAGRVVGADGRPRAGLKVKTSYRYQELEAASAGGADSPGLPWELYFDYPAWDKILNREATTDKDGRFRLDGLVPGLKYDLAVRDGEATELSRESLSVESGKANDLGDLKAKTAPANDREE